MNECWIHLETVLKIGDVVKTELIDAEWLITEKEILGVHSHSNIVQRWRGYLCAYSPFEILVPSRVWIVASGASVIYFQTFG